MRFRSGVWKMRENVLEVEHGTDHLQASGRWRGNIHHLKGLQMKPTFGSNKNVKTGREFGERRLRTDSSSFITKRA